MIALTQLLNERDEQIMALQDELEAYDRNQAALENKLDEKTTQCIQIQRLELEGERGRHFTRQTQLDMTSLCAAQIMQS